MSFDNRIEEVSNLMSDLAHQVDDGVIEMATGLQKFQVHMLRQGDCDLLRLSDVLVLESLTNRKVVTSANMFVAPLDYAPQEGDIAEFVQRLKDYYEGWFYWDNNAFPPKEVKLFEDWLRSRGWNEDVWVVCLP